MFIALHTRQLAIVYIVIAFVFFFLCVCVYYMAVKCYTIQVDFANESYSCWLESASKEGEKFSGLYEFISTARSLALSSHAKLRDERERASSLKIYTFQFTIRPHNNESSRSLSLPLLSSRMTVAKISGGQLSR
ncbi:hypothetical protein TSAR_013050 [Trichomalopsis sarcophagae]|uniref:Uncharacterized protein n=1 Tax=Trichomalopsis sarcophagae TaxID=543379 RepID=A0A232FM34_9HYME|nr:hypothetical protein TSAR_013050 [Trichomalopsis sarcophagae]